MFRSLLVPLDGSPFSEHALPLALSIARRAGARLHIVHVHTTVVVSSPESPVWPIDDSLEQHFEEHLQGYLHSVAERIERVSEVPVNRVLLKGSVAESIRVSAESLGADLIVMTTHARSPLGRIWLGSVADELVRELPMPILLVRSQEGLPDLSKAPVLQHVLLPLDGSALAEQMIEPAVALGGLMGADYTLLRVIRPPTPVGFRIEGGSLGERAQSILDQIAKLQDQLYREAADYLDRVAERLRRQSLHVQTKVAIEHQPAAAILHEAMAPAIDLVALETHGRKGLSRLFRGSVADKVIRGASVPILVHRPVFV